MQSKFRRTGALACAGAVVFGALAVAAGTQADAQQTPLDQLIGQPTPGLAALDKVQSRLAEIAQSNGLSEQKLRDVVATADPASGQSNAGTPTGLGASAASTCRPAPTTCASTTSATAIR